MPENIRALIIILVLAVALFAFARRPALAIIGTEDFTRRRNLWLAFTVTSLASLNFWIYALVALLLLIFANRREANIPALFFFLLFVLPMDLVAVPGFGMMQYFFQISHPRLLALLILFPAYLALRKQSDYVPLGRLWTDRFFIAFLVLMVSLSFRDALTETDAMRYSFYRILDIFLPYVVFSRALKHMQAFRDVVFSFVLAVMVLALVAAVEFYKKWLLYDTLIVALQQGTEWTTYLARDGMLRVSASAGHPIVLGFIMMVAIGLYLFIARSIEHRFVRRLGMVVLAIGLFAPLSRGPWVGTAVLLFFFLATGKYAFRRLIGLGATVLVLLFMISELPGGEKVINLLPFVGTTESGNIDYRQKLVTNSMIVIQRNPWLGSGDFLETPEMEELRQGQGIIDVVNSYIAITLKSGIIGLGLFAGFFGLIIMGILQTMRSIADKNSEEYLLGRVLLATLIAILVTIVTVSSILSIPIVYWSLAGMSVAYVQMVRKNRMGTSGKN